MEKKNNLMFEK